VDIEMPDDLRETGLHPDRGGRMDIPWDRRSRPSKHAMRPLPFRWSDFILLFLFPTFDTLSASK
jgi:hypothetical protein